MTVLQMPKRGRGDVRPELEPSPPLRVMPLLVEQGGVVRLTPEVQERLGVKPGAALFLVFTETTHTLRDAESYAALRAGAVPGATQELLALVTMRIEVKP